MDIKVSPNRALADRLVTMNFAVIADQSALEAEESEEWKPLMPWEWVPPGYMAYGYKYIRDNVAAHMDPPFIDYREQVKIALQTASIDTLVEKCSPEVILAIYSQAVYMPGTDDEFIVANFWLVEDSQGIRADRTTILHYLRQYWTGTVISTIANSRILSYHVYKALS